jgi:predicted outer membrane repeat protein
LFGGGLYNEGNVTIQDSVFHGNVANESGGGGVASYGNIFVGDSSFTANTAPAGFGGGGIFAGDGTLTISGSTFSGNQGYEGGGIATRQDMGTPALEISSSTFAGNQATGEGGLGGGISSNGSLQIEGSTFSGNTSPNSGGGLYHINESAAIINSTFSGNSANASGGGIYFRDAAMSLDYVTITANTADADNDGDGDGGGLYFEASPEVGNSLIAENSDLSGGGPDCFMDTSFGSPLTSLDYNLIGDTTGCDITGATANNLSGVSPVLGPLQDNGGPTQTHALLAGSPALDAANPASCLATDQRGVSRPQPAAGRCDIGAYEGQYPEIEVRVGPTVIPANTGSFDFGATVEGTPLDVTFTVHNTGDSDLVLTPPITLPAGFSLVSTFATTTVPPGSATTFVVRLEATTAGTFSGQLSFGNNDGDENPYNFLISGTVSAAPTATSTPTATPTATPTWTPLPPPPGDKHDDRDDDGDDDAPPPPAAPAPPQAQRFDCWPWLVIVPPGAAPDVAPGQWCQASLGQPLPAPATLRYLDHSTEVVLKDSAGNPITSFALPIKVCFRYTQLELDAVGGAPASFLIQVFRDGQWTALPTAPDSTLGQPGVCAPVDHLTLFALFERPPATQTFPKYLPETGER